MEETKNKIEEIKNKSGRREEFVMWYQPHMINFYSVVIASTIVLVYYENILSVLSSFESSVVILCMFILIVLIFSMWNNCMIRQTVEEIKTELKRTK